VKVVADVGVELRQIYLSGRHSHHPNDAPQQKSPNPNYRTEERDPPLSPATGAAKGERERTNALAGGGREIGRRRPVSRREG
jgi:hypothetical protein